MVDGSKSRRDNACIQPRARVPLTTPAAEHGPDGTHRERLVTRRIGYAAFIRPDPVSPTCTAARHGPRRRRAAVAEPRLRRHATRPELIVPGLHLGIGG